MARTNIYNVVSEAAHGIARDVAESVIEELRHFANRITPGEYETRDDWETELREEMSELIHQGCDSALIYTADQWALAWGLPDSDESPEDLGSEDFDSMLSARAYLNLREHIERWDFDEAISILCDEIEARQPKATETETETEGGAL